MSNLPPGVSVNDIPGNRPEDEAEEKFFDELGKRLDAIEVSRKSLADEVPEFLWETEWFNQVIVIARDMGYDQGYSDGKMEAEIERADSTR